MKSIVLGALLLLQSGAKPAVIGNPKSHVYHTAQCVHYLTCKSCTEGFKTVDAAKAAGYHFCNILAKGQKRP